MGRHRPFPDRKQYERDYFQKVRKPRQQEAPQQERAEETFLLSSSRFFDIHRFLRNTGKRNYCLSLFLGEKKKLTQYLEERGAFEDQISTVFKILADIVKE